MNVIKVEHDSNCETFPLSDNQVVYPKPEDQHVAMKCSMLEITADVSSAFTYLLLHRSCT